MRRKHKAAKLVVAAKDGRHVLLVRRRRDGLWALPGGKRNGGSESFKKCLSREIEEEYRTEITEAQLRNAPAFGDDSWLDRDWEIRTHQHYGAPEYWVVLAT